MKDNDFNNLPRSLKLLITANGQDMDNFYALPPEEREKLLASVSDTNKRMNEYKKLL